MPVFVVILVEYDRYCLSKIDEVLKRKRAPNCERAQECNTLEGAIVSHTTGIRDAAEKKRDFLGIFPKGGGGLLKSQNFCKFTKCFFVCQNHS